MSAFFSLDGPFYKYGGLLADIMLLSVVWLVCSIPVVTIGASTTALFYVTTRRIANREGYILRDFWTAFKSNFKKSTVIWLIFFAVGFLLVINILNLWFNGEIMGGMTGFFLSCQICFLIEMALISIYLFPIAARFDMPVKQVLKTAFFMANRHLLTSILCLALGAALIVGIILFPILFLLAMGIYAWLASYMIMRVFKKYRPEMDKDPVQELQEIEAEISANRRELTEFQRLEQSKIAAGEARMSMDEANISAEPEVETVNINGNLY